MRLLKTALRELERAPEDVRSASDVASLTEFIRRALAEEGADAPGPADDRKP